MRKLYYFFTFSFILLLSNLQMNATVCGVDTVRYTMEKATGYGSIGINNTSSATALAQFYNAPQAITIYGFDFYGNSETLPSMTINAYIYRAGPDSLPTGGPLASASIVVDSSTDSNLNQVVFASPVTVTFPYLLVVSNPSADNFAIYSNDWLVGDGGFDNLASAQIGVTWFTASGLLVGGDPFNADAIFNPYVSYTIIANDTITPVPLCAGGTATVTDKSSPILRDPMYSVAAFYDIDSVQYTYSITGFPTVNDDNFSILIPPVGTYSVDQTDTMFGWSGICVASVTKSVTVTTTPTSPSSISGPASLCAGGSAVYSVPPVSGATSYVWTLPSGWTGTSTTNSITVIASSASGNVTVYARNSCGNSAATTLAVVSSGSISIPGPITGITNPCAGTSVTYTIARVASASSYAWTLPSGWSGTSTDTFITCIAGASSGNIGVSSVSISCGLSAPSTLFVAPRNVPDFSGANLFIPTPLCTGSTKLFVILGVSNAITYQWSLPGGWTGSSTSDSLITTISSTSGSIIITAINACGLSDSFVRTATVSTLPSTPGTISGDLTPCEGGNATYSIAPVAGATSYLWTLPSGWSGFSTTESIRAMNNNTAGIVSVVATNDCGNSAASTVSVTPSPSGITAVLTPTPASSAVSSNGAIAVGTPSGGTAPYQYSIDSISYQSSPTFGSLLPGTYTITIRDTNGCTSRLTVVVSFGTGIAMANQSTISFEVYPNPAQSLLQVSASFAQEVSTINFSIYDLLGSRLLNRVFTNAQHLHETIDISALAAGEYLVKMEANGVVQQHQLSVVR